MGIEKTKIWATAFKEKTIRGKQISLSQEVRSTVVALAGSKVTWGDETNTLWIQGGGAELNDNIKMCGPQVEFFYDRGEKYGCGRKKCNPLCGCGRFLEIGNILFIKHYIDYNDNEKIKNLNNPSTEAVIGLERIAWIVEKANTIFDTSFFPTSLGNNSTQETPDRILRDNLKALIFILSEKRIEPGKRDRNRIVRRLLRNVISAMLALGLDIIMLERLAKETALIYQPTYPDLTAESTLALVLQHIPVYMRTVKRAHRELLRMTAKNGEEDTAEISEIIINKYGLPSWLVSWLHREVSIDISKVIQ